MWYRLTCAHPLLMHVSWRNAQHAGCRSGWLKLSLRFRGHGFGNMKQFACSYVSSMMTSSNGDIFCVTGYWPFVYGIHRSPMNSPHKGHWRGALMFSFICAWINGWVNYGEASDLRRHRAHYDVTVMSTLKWHPWRNCNGDLAKPPLQLGHGWVDISHIQ